MNTVERFQAMEALWDSLLHEDVEIETPGWHRDVLEDIEDIYLAEKG